MSCSALNTLEISVDTLDKNLRNGLSIEIKIHSKEVSSVCWPSFFNGPWNLTDFLNNDKAMASRICSV